MPPFHALNVRVQVRLMLSDPFRSVQSFESFTNGRVVQAPVFDAFPDGRRFLIDHVVDLTLGRVGRSLDA